MSLKLVFLIAGLTGLAGVAGGYALRWIVALGKKGSVELEIKQLLLTAKEQAQKIVTEGEEKAKTTLREMRSELQAHQNELKRTEGRLIKKEEGLDKRQTDVDAQVEKLRARHEEVKASFARAKELEDKNQAALQEVAQLSLEAAQERLLTRIEEQHSADMMVRLQKLESAGVERLEKKARDILSTAIHRLGNSVAPDVLTTTVSLHSDDLKGKIIGKEGRNIKAFERASGVEVIVDDTPGLITLSSFDPIRRHVARLALENLIVDGRIQPARIEEMVEKAQKEITKIIKEKGEQAAYECGVLNADPRLLGILGRLHFRTSYGQNVLQHSIEMAHIAGMIAQELGANVAIARAGALFHDIGKAVDHEVQGTHVEIGRRILQKFGADQAIIQAMQSHHEEYPYETLESIIVQVADAISGGRPGARRDSVENYLKRLSELEDIANSFEGVDRSFALQAGREIRIFVTPDNVTDFAAHNIARDVAGRVEQELKYPGEIKVTVIRETRAIEYAR